MRLSSRLFLAATVGALLCACGDSPSGSTDVAVDVPSNDTSADTAQPDVSEDVVEDTIDDVEDVEDTSEPDDTTPDGTADVAVPCAADQCDIDGECFDNDTVNPDNPCEICLVVLSVDDWSYGDGGSCDDGDVCTTDDACFEGTCMGTIMMCPSSDPCMSGVCDPDVGCMLEPVEAGGACDDGDPCTLNDTCNAAGTCEAGGDTLACGSDNPCVAARCEAGVGCVEEILSDVSCDDGNACTVGDMCQEGACIAGTEPLDCDDANLCTLNWCDPESGCQERSIADQCADTNPCTDEMCSPTEGCVYPFNTDPCNDGLTCTSVDTCTEGACRGVPVVSDDENICTDDMCVEPGGVANIPNTDACDDANACTIGDTCADGGCVPGDTPLDCNDDNVCTDDDCDPSDGCTYVNNVDDCDDGNMCTMGDVCGDGSCSGAPVNCDDGNECTIDACDPDTGCSHTLILSNDCRPVIALTYPPRAATILDDGTGTITVTGTVESGAGDIDTFTINGEAVTVGAEGAFSLEVTPSNGGNFLVIEAEDAMGSPRKVVQSYAFSQSYVLPDVAAGTGYTTEGLGLYVGDGALAAVSDVLVAVLDGLDIGALLGDDGSGDPLFDEAGIKVYLRDDVPSPVTFDAPTVVMDSTLDGIALEIGIPNLAVYLRLDGYLCADGNKTYRANAIDLEALISLSVTDNVLSGGLSGVNATISGGGFSGSCWLLDLANSFLKTELETAVEEAISEQLGEVLTDSLSDLALEFELDFPSLNPEGDDITIQLTSDFNSVATDDDGLNMNLRTIVTSETAVPYTNLGIPERNGCGTPPQTLAYFEEDDFEVVLADDSVNQLLWGAWNGGFLEFDVPPSLLGDVDLSTYGITDLELSASGMLAPVAGDCGGDSLTAHIGDLRIDADMDLFGAPLQVILYISLAADFEIGAADGEITFAISDIDRVELQVEILDDAFIGVESTFEALILDNLVPALLDGLGGDALGSFALPEIGLDGLIDGATGTIQIVTENVRRNEGNTVVGGALEMN